MQSIFPVPFPSSSIPKSTGGIESGEGGGQPDQTQRDMHTPVSSDDGNHHLHHQEREKWKICGKEIYISFWKPNPMMMEGEGSVGGWFRVEGGRERNVGDKLFFFLKYFKFYTRWGKKKRKKTTDKSLEYVPTMVVKDDPGNGEEENV